MIGACFHFPSAELWEMTARELCFWTERAAEILEGVK